MGLRWEEDGDKDRARPGCRLRMAVFALAILGFLLWRVLEAAAGGRLP